MKLLLKIRWNACGDRDVLMSGFSQKPVCQFGAEFCVAESGGDSQNLQLRAAQGQGYGEGVVHIVADVGVDDDFFCAVEGWLKTGKCRWRHRF